MGPVQISNWALNLWCCILSFTFVTIIWLIPFFFVLFLIVFLFYQGKRYQNDPDFKWGDMFTTFIFYFLILLVAHLFLRIWDFLGIPIDHVRATLHSGSLSNNSTSTTPGTGGSCIMSWTSTDISCCANLVRYDTISPIIDLIVNVIILFTKIISIVGTIAMIFFWGYTRYKHAKPGFVSGQVNIAIIIAQSVIAGFVVVIFLALIFYAYEHLLFFNIYSIIRQVFSCV